VCGLNICEFIAICHS